MAGASSLSLFLTVACAEEEDEDELEQVRAALKAAGIPEDVSDVSCAEPILPAGEIEDETEKAERETQCEKSKEWSRQQARFEYLRKQDGATLEDNVAISNEWRERRQSSDPEQYTQLKEQCEADSPHKADERRRIVGVTECMRMAWR